MRAVIQRVKSASLSVDGTLISEIGKGYAVYWPAGYKRGYEDIKQAMANDPV